MAQAKVKSATSADLAQFLPKVQPRARNVVVGRRVHKRKHPPVGETAHDRFVRIGTARVKNTLRDIRLIGNLSSANYDYTPDELKVMKAAIERALDQSFAKFGKTRQQVKLEEAFAFAD